MISPPSIRAALRAVNYGRPDVRVSIVASDERVSLSPTAGDGYRGFTALCRLDGSESHEIQWGSWGGSNPWNHTIDDATHPAHLPRGFAMVQGTIGGGRPVYASISVGQADVAPILPPTSAVSSREAKILAVYRSIKGGHRGEYLQRHGATPADLDALVARGLLKRNRAGAISITTEGRNAAAREYF